MTRLLALPSFDHGNTEIYMLKETDTDRERKGGDIEGSIIYLSIYMHFGKTFQEVCRREWRVLSNKCSEY